MELELQQLDLRNEWLRRRCPESERRLLASLAQKGQQVPIVVVPDGAERYVVIDGHKRFRSLKALKSDTVLATAWELAEPEALILERLMRASGNDDPFERGWLLCTLQQRFALSRAELAKRFDRSESWVSRHLDLVGMLPDEVQDRVRRGQIAPYSAMKYLVPLARANRKGCVQLVEALGTKAPATRQMEALCRAWGAGDEQSRGRLLADPWLFLKVQEELKRDGPLEKPAAQRLLGDLGAIAAISRRASSHLREGIARQLKPEERGEVALCFAQARADTETLFHLFDKELPDARPEPAHGNP